MERNSKRCRNRRLGGTRLEQMDDARTQGSALRALLNTLIRMERATSAGKKSA